MTDPIRGISSVPNALSSHLEKPGSIGQTSKAGTPAGADEALSLGASKLVADFDDSGAQHGLGWHATRVGAEAACLALPCAEALRLSTVAMPDDDLAEKMMGHFLSGSSDPVSVDLTAELARNPQLREYLASHIEFELLQRHAAGEEVTRMNGAVWVKQGDYGDSDAGKDQRLSLGGTLFEYQVVGSSDDGGLEIQLNVSDHYFWSPSEERPTQCLHECAAELVGEGRSNEFYQFGEGALSVRDPRSSRVPPMMPLSSPPTAPN